MSKQINQQAHVGCLTRDMFDAYINPKPESEEAREFRIRYNAALYARLVKAYPIPEPQQSRKKKR